MSSEAGRAEPGNNGRPPAGGMGGVAVSVVTIVTALFSVAAGALFGYAYGVYIEGHDEVVRALAEAIDGWGTLITTSVAAAIVILLIRWRRVQDLMGGAYNDYREIREAAEDLPILKKIELAKAYAFSSSITTAAVLGFIALITAARILAER